MHKITAIIIEDEFTSQQYLQQLLSKEFPQIRILAIVDNVPEAVNALQQLEPDLIFIDIEIKLGTGFDVLARLEKITFDIIFTTAFNQFAIDAFKYHAVDYLLKPLDKKRTIETITHSIANIETRKKYQQINSLLQYVQSTQIHKHSIGIHTMDGIEFIELNDILFLEAKGNYTELNMRSGVKIITSKKLKDMEQVLPEPLFFRIHHSYIVNSKYIKKYNRGRGGYITLTNESSLPVSAARRDAFLKAFAQ